MLISHYQLGLNYPEGLDRLTSMMEDFCHCCTVLNMIATAVHNPEKIEEVHAALFKYPLPLLIS